MSASRARLSPQSQDPTARRSIRRAAPVPLHEALETLEATLDISQYARLRGEVYCFAAAGVVIARTLAFEQQQAGRRVQLTIYGLHRLLGGPASEGELPSEAARDLEPWAEWLADCGRMRATRWPLLMRWVDIFSERLTMNRYGDRQRRRLHAKGLLADPLLLILSETTEGPPPSPGKIGALEDFCETLLAVWDLVHAAEVATCGWNRLELPPAEQLGGFYGLSDTAQPPRPEVVRQTAQDLLGRLDHAPLLDSPLDSPLAALAERARLGLTAFLECGAWPEPDRHENQPSLPGKCFLGRMADRIRHRKHRQD